MSRIEAARRTACEMPGNRATQAMPLLAMRGPGREAPIE